MKATIASVVALWFAGFTLPALAEEPAGPTPKAEETATTAQSEEATAAEPEEFNEQTFVREFQGLLQKGEFDEAEKQLKEALESHPDSPRLNSLHYIAFYYLRNAGRNEQAFEHLKTHVDLQLKSAAENGRNTEQFANYLGLLVDLSAQLGGAEKAAEVLDDYATRAQASDRAREQLVAAVDSQRAIQLGKSNRIEEARAIINAQVEAAAKALSDSPGEADAIIRTAIALKDRAKLEGVVEGGDPNKATTELLDFLLTQAQGHADSSAVVRRFETEHLSRASALARTDPDAAEALLDRLENFDKHDEAEAAEGTEQAPARRLSFNVGPTIARLRAQIENTRKMLALVGAPAMYPENVDGWVNGDALTLDSLKGKVVLLDFFAVWCGPCIATFPHMREWHDEFADKGLQIIGVTNYYQYGWDESAGRPRQAELEPEAERAAMEQFVKHHELRHTIAYVTGRELQDFYVVNGIPHVVVIDRQGKVRLFRIGSGDQNAAEIKQAIEDCLAESPPAE